MGQPSEGFETFMDELLFNLGNRISFENGITLGGDIGDGHGNPHGALQGVGYPFYMPTLQGNIQTTTTPAQGSIISLDSIGKGYFPILRINENVEIAIKFIDDRGTVSSYLGGGNYGEDDGYYDGLGSWEWGALALGSGGGVDGVTPHDAVTASLEKTMTYKLGLANPNTKEFYYAPDTAMIVKTPTLQSCYLGWTMAQHVITFYAFEGVVNYYRFKESILDKIVDFFTPEPSVLITGNSASYLMTYNCNMVTEYSTINGGLNPNDMDSNLSKCVEGAISITENFINRYEIPTTMEQIAEAMLTGKMIEDGKPFDDNSWGSGYGGGTIGQFDSTASIGHPGVPSFGVESLGVANMYLLDISSCYALSQWLGSTDIDDMISKIFSNPFDYIMSLQLFPCYPTTGEQKAIHFGGITSPIVATTCNQYRSYDFGTLDMSEYFGTYLDYNSNVSIYLPFIGVKELDTNTVMNSILSLHYNVDFFSGSCLATLKIIKKNGSPDSDYSNVVYHYSGTLSAQIPLTATNYSAVISGALGAIGSGVTGLAMGNPSALGGVASSIASMHTTSEKSGSIASNPGMMDVMVPYIIMDRPVSNVPSNNAHFNGYVSNVNSTLGSLSGYTEVEKIVLDDIPGITDNEKDALKSLLESGVYL